MGTWDSTYTSSANKTPLIFIWTKNGSKLIVFDQICGPKLTQILLKIDLKWTKNGPGIDQKWPKNGPWMSSTSLQAYKLVEIQNRPFFDKNYHFFPKLIRTSIRFENVKNLKIVYLSTTKSFLDHFFPKKKNFCQMMRKKFCQRNFFCQFFCDKKRDRKIKNSFLPSAE